MISQSNFSARELKSLKKEDLIHLLLESQKKNISGSDRSVPNMETNNGLPSPAQQSSPLTFATLKGCLSQAVSELKEELSLEFNDRMSHLSEEIVRLQSEVSALKNDIEASRSIAKSEILSELREQESRRCNLILFGAEESNTNSTDSDGTRKHDEELVSNIKSIVKLPHAKIRSTFRLGMRKPNGYPRPIKVVFDSTSERDSFLRAAPSLTNAHGKFRKIFIKPDLTPAEQEADRKLHAELRTRKEKGELVKIRKGRIISEAHSETKQTTQRF